MVYGCRNNEYLESEEGAQNEKIDAFVRFERVNSNRILNAEIISKNNGDSLQFSYGEPFAEIIQNFLESHPKYARQLEEVAGVIRLDAVSQTFGENEKAVIFPVVDKNGKVVSAWGGIVNENRDYVNFYYLNNDSPELKSIIKRFQEHYDRKISGKEAVIEEVIIYGHVSLPMGNHIPWWYDGGSSGGGGNSSPGWGSGMSGDGGLHGGGGGNNTNSNNGNPCDKVKSNLNDNKFKEKANTLNNSTVLNYNHEMGFASSYAPAGTNLGTQYVPMDNKIGTHSVRLPNGNSFFGFMHTHNNEDGVIKIFSPADVMTFLTSCVNNANTNGNIEDAYAMVITSEGSYMLQYGGTSTNFGNLASSLNSWNNQYKDLFRNALENSDGNLSQSVVENIFLKFLNDIVNINGLELYKVTDTNSNKLSLNPNNTTNSTPCP